MDEKEFELKKLEIVSRDTQFTAIQGVKKVIYGTMIVGLAAAIFPFAQKWSELSFDARIKQANQAIERTKNDRTFLERIGDEGRSKSIDERVRLAEFYSFLANKKTGERAQWEKFRVFLENKVKTLNARAKALRQKCQDDRKSDLDCVNIEEELEQIARYLKPKRQKLNSDKPNCTVTRSRLPFDLTVENHRLEGVDFCLTHNNAGPMAERPKYIVIGYSASIQSPITVARYFQDSRALVSSHLIIGRDGSVIQMGKFNQKLFHAGKSQFKGQSQFNRFSIGITLINAGKLKGEASKFVTYTGAVISPKNVKFAKHKYIQNSQTFPWQTYSNKQIGSLVRILKVLSEQYSIPVEKIIGQEDISQGRKLSPGPLLPWDAIRTNLLK